MSHNRYAVIMAGGSGTRFWPMSREENPKQFLDMMDSGQSLIQMTYQRLKRSVGHGRVYVVAHERYTEKILEQLPELKEEHIISEPDKKNTAPCVLLSNMKIEQRNPDAIIITSPADHHISKDDQFDSALETACEFAEHNDALITLGIKPAWPSTGYGYIEVDEQDIDSMQKVKRFVEKPNQQKAKDYIEAKRFYWNAGIFIWSAKSISKSFELHSPNLSETMHKVLDGNFDRDRVVNCYQQIESISVDYAIMENAQNIYTLPVDFGWSDIGTWNALYNMLSQNPEQNVLIKSRLLEYESSGNLFLGKEKKLIVARGLKDFIVVDMEDVLMIFPKKEEQKIKELVTEIRTDYKELS